MTICNSCGVDLDSDSDTVISIRTKAETTEHHLCPICADIVRSHVGLKKRKSSRAVNLQGKRYGHLTVIRLVEGGSSRWLCRCDCGRETVVYATNLTSGRSTSCGCFRTKHRESKTKLYKIYMQIRSKGSSWESYDEFKRWAIANGYKEGASIRRYDTALGYSAENSYVYFTKSGK